MSCIRHVSAERLLRVPATARGRCKPRLVRIRKGEFVNVKYHAMRLAMATGTVLLLVEALGAGRRF